MPDPADFASEADWMAACVPEVEGEGKPHDQAVAQCLNMWRNRGAKAVPAMTTRAWSRFEIKAVNEDRREVEGIATTPTTDRIGDIVEPRGAVFNLPLALLWQHMHDESVGEVTSAKVTDRGIEVRARLAKIDEPGLLKDMVDKAWQSVKHRLVKGLSIGFRSIEHSFLDDGDGIRFSKWEWLELSLVTIPANAEATITNIKRFDAQPSAATGQEGVRGSPGNGSPGVAGTGRKPKPVRLKAMNTQHAERIRELENARAAKSAQCEEIMGKAADEGRTTDADEDERFEELQGEIEAIDKSLKRYQWLETKARAEAAPVNGKSAEGASRSRDPAGSVRVKRVEDLSNGIGFARFAKCMALAQGQRSEAARIAERLYGAESDVTLSLKAAVVAGTTDSGSWTGSLVGTESNIFADFAAYLRPRTIVGRFGQNGVPSLRRVPFRTRLVSQTGAGSGYWVGEANAKPLTAFDFADTSLTPLKVASITVVSEELMRDSSPSAEAILRDQLVEACRARMDTDFIAPGKTAVSGVSPASITNGISLTAASGATAADVRADIGAVMDTFATADNPPENGVWIMSSRQALRLNLMRNDLGQDEFPNVSMNGGMFMGLPVITSTQVATAAAGSPPTNQGNIYLINASDIYFADEGDFMVDMSREASLEMADNPTQSGATGSPLAPVASTVVSLWQNNLVGLRAERTINWARRRASAVAGISAAAYGQ